MKRRNLLFYMVDQIAEEKIKILIECPDLIASVRVGVIETLRPLEKQGKIDLLFIPTRKIRKKHICWCDILITVRAAEKMSQSIVESAKKAGRFVIYFLDDDLLSIPQGLSCSPYYLSEDTRESIKTIIGKCDCFWCVNSLVLEKYRAYCHGKSIICYSPSNMQRTSEISRKYDGGIINVLFAGSKDHSGILQEIISPAVVKVIGRHKNDVKFIFIGGDSGIRKNASVENIKYFDNYNEYDAFVQERSFDIGLAIIGNDDFYKCKYANKYLEYTKIGSLGVYTNSMPYTDVIRDGVNGFLCENTPEGWDSAIEKAITSIKNGEDLISNAVEDVLTNYDAEKLCNELTEKIPEIKSYHAPLVQVKEVKKIYSNWSYYMKQTKLIWRQYNILFLPICFVRMIKMIFIRIKTYMTDKIGGYGR